MTMHLLGPQFTTNNTKKAKNKKLQDYTLDWKQYNKQMRKIGAKEKTLDEYIDYRTGKMKLSKKKQPVRIINEQTENSKIPSFGDLVGTIPAKPEKQYSGERKLLGIATTHKSNLVPVFSEQDAKDVASMRR